jgi:hypothetical protein
MSECHFTGHAADILASARQQSLAGMLFGKRAVGSKSVVNAAVSSSELPELFKRCNKLRSIICLVQIWLMLVLHSLHPEIVKRHG